MKPALAAAALGSFLVWRTPRRPAAEKAPALREEAASPGEAMTSIYLSACGGTIRDVTGVRSPDARAVGRDRFEMTMHSARVAQGRPLVFEYDAKAGQVRPLNEDARAFLHPRKGCR